jgi:hypothetical protein
LETNGAIGNFGMTLQYGEIGFYQWKMDLNNFIIPERLVLGGCTRDFIAKKD